jgi:hypothetical protein
VPGDQACGSEGDGLLGRAALAVDRHARDALRPASREDCIAGYVDCLFADLPDAAPDDVLGQGGVDPGGLGEATEYMRREVDGLDVGEPAVALPGGAGRQQ